VRKVGGERRERNDKFPIGTHGLARGDTQHCWTRQDQLGYLLYLEIELDRYHIDKSAAFLDIGFPREALRELSYVRSSSNNQRRAALISVLQAQAYFSLRKYAESCSLAEEALSIIKPIHSVVNYERIQTLYSQLKLTNFGDNPEVARLGVMIHQIHVCWHGKNGKRERL